MKNEALRIFLASAALLLTALLANPMGDFASLPNEKEEIKVSLAQQQSENRVEKKQVVAKKAEPKKKSRSSRSFAFFFHR